jgi:hypothetical protein
MTKLPPHKEDPCLVGVISLWFWKNDKRLQGELHHLLLFDSTLTALIILSTRFTPLAQTIMQSGNAQMERRCGLSLSTSGWENTQFEPLSRKSTVVFRPASTWIDLICSMVLPSDPTQRARIM